MPRTSRHLSPPRLLHVVVSLDHGGLERLVVDWTHLRNEQHPGSTEVCCLDRRGDLAGELPGDRVAALGAQRATWPFDPGAVRRLRQIVKSRGIDVVHSHNLAARQYAALATVGLRRVLHVHTEHGTNPHTGGIKNRWRNRVLNRLTDVIVAVSEDTAEAVSRSQHVRRAKVRVVPNGVSASQPLAAERIRALRNQFGIPETARVLGSIGRLASVKGYDRLIPAFARLVGQRAEATQLLLIGDGPERDALQALAVEWGVADRVRFVGYRDDARDGLGLMHGFVLPSRGEGLSIALLEAMAAGCPVAVTDVGENRAVIADGEAGVLLPEDESVWPDILGRLLERRDERVEAMCRNARSRASEVYSMQRTLDAYERLYRGGEGEVSE